MIDADLLACLHRQVTKREGCPHTPRHESVADAIARKYAAGSPPEVEKRLRAACAPRK